MATLMSLGGNFGTAGSWALCDSTAELDNESAAVALTTGYVLSSTFTPGAITIDGIAVKVGSRSASPTGTMSVALDQATVTVVGTEIAVNVSDIDAGGTGWHLFKFAAPVLLIAATAYSVKAKTSSSTQVSIYRNATTGNWNRQLRTTTTQAPAAADKIIVAGELTGAGTGNNISITMDNISTTVYGNVSFPQSITVNKRGTLAYGATASTAYNLKVAGIVQVNGGGTLTIGTSGTPMPSTSSGVLDFSVASNVDSGLHVNTGGTFESNGNAITNTRAFLNADAAISATSLTTDISTGWLSGDEIAIASTTRTATECEKTSLTAPASGTTLTVTAIVAAHSGSGATKAEIANLTRNVKIKGASITLQAYVTIATTATYTSKYTEYAFMGSAVANKLGVSIATTTGACDIQYCALHDFVVTGSVVFSITGSASNNITLSNNNTYNVQTNHLNLAATSGTTITFNNNLCIRSLSDGAVRLSDVGLTFTNNTLAGATGNGMFITEASSTLGTFSGNIIHSNTLVGIACSGPIFGTVSTTTLWRNNGGGVSVNTGMVKFTFDGLVAFGNSVGVDISGTFTSLIELRFANCTFNAGSTLVQSSGISINATPLLGRMIVDSCSFGATTTHATADINIAGAFRHVNRMIIRNSILASTNKIGTVANLAGGSYIGTERAGQSGGINFAQFAYADGVIGRYDIDAVIFDVTPSLRITPASATIKIESPRFKSAVGSGTALIPTIKVRKSVVGDGGGYNGSNLRLFVASNPAVGITSDTLLATSTSASSGAFEALSGTTVSAIDNGAMEFYVDGDGTAGWFNLDTLTID